MDRSNAYKLDPHLRRLADWRPVEHREGRRARDAENVPLFVKVANAQAAQWVHAQQWASELVHVVDDYYTVTVPVRHLADLAVGDGIVDVEAVRFFRPHLNRSLASIHGRKRPIGDARVPDGKGVVIGIVDYGLDVELQDFHDAHGKTRVAYLWDQELTPRVGEAAPREYGYGVEYSSEHITAGFIRHDPLNADPTISGHGTHVAGIAAGNGRTADREFPAGKYVGVAPAATIVFVNVKRSELLHHVGAAGGTLANSIKLAHAITYCFQKAEALGMPCVVNLSMGFHGGGHDGNTAVESIIEALLRKPGRAVVIAAGNEDRGNGDVYAAGALRKGEQTTLEWRIGDPDASQDDPTPNELEVWYPRGNAMKVWLLGPEKRESTKSVAPGEDHRFEFAAGEEVNIHSDAATPWNGAARIHIALNKGRRATGIRAGTWRVRLKAVQLGLREPRRRVRFDAWIEREIAPMGAPQRSRFGKRHYGAKTKITLTTPSTARQAITVASYVNNGSSRARISTWSSRGPTRDGRLKPELAAPGQAVFSTNARAGQPDGNGSVRRARVEMSGTSMAAPHVAGVIARMLSRNRYLTAEEIRDILIRSATPPPNGIRWDKKWGYGKVNAARAVDLVEQLLKSRAQAAMAAGPVRRSSSAQRS